jgi:hypothetical protein
VFNVEILCGRVGNFKVGMRGRKYAEDRVYLVDFDVGVWVVFFLRRCVCVCVCVCARCTSTCTLHLFNRLCSPSDRTLCCVQSQKNWQVKKGKGYMR